MTIDQGQFALEGVRPTVEQQLVARGQRRLGRVDAAHEEPGRHVGEGGEALAPGRQEDARAQPGDRGRRGAGVVDPVPVVARALAPARPFQPQEREAGALAGDGRGARDALCERVCGIHDGCDAILRQPLRKAGGAAEASHAHLALGQSRALDPTGERRDHGHAVARERGGEHARLTGTAEQQHARLPHAGDGRSRDDE